MRERTVSALTLRSSRNVQGAFYYYSLVTGRRLHRRRYTPIPMSQEAIDRVHYIADKQKSPGDLVFLLMNGVEFEDLVDAPPPIVNNHFIHHQ